MMTVCERVESGPKDQPDLRDDPVQIFRIQGY